MTDPTAAGAYISSAEEARRIMDLPRKYAIAIKTLKDITLSGATEWEPARDALAMARNTLKELGE